MANENSLGVVSEAAYRVQTTRWWKLLGLQMKKKTTNKSVPYKSLVEFYAQRPVCVLPSTFSDCESLIGMKTSSAQRTARHLRRRRWLKELQRRPKINLKFGSTPSTTVTEESDDAESYLNSLPYTRLRESCVSIDGVEPANGEKQHARREEKTGTLRRFFKLPRVFTVKSAISKNDVSRRTSATITKKFGIRYEPLAESSESSESLIKLS